MTLTCTQVHNNSKVGTFETLYVGIFQIPQSEYSLNLFQVQACYNWSSGFCPKVAGQMSIKAAGRSNGVKNKTQVRVFFSVGHCSYFPLVDNTQVPR